MQVDAFAPCPMKTDTCQKHILVVEDDTDVSKLLATKLRQEGFAVQSSADGASAVEMTRLSLPHLMILDLMLPELSGWDVCKILKNDLKTRHIPIVILSAKAESDDRILGLELGADDYLTKPFSPRELILRVRAILRNPVVLKNADDLLGTRDVKVCRSRVEVTAAGKMVELTSMEFKLLVLLIERRGRVQTRDVLLNDVWGYEGVIETRTVDTHVQRLRDKLGNVATRIETVRGLGYRLVDP